jgi:hypothetical protein
MSAEVTGATIGAIALLIATALTVIYGPTWKDRSDRRRAQVARSELLIARYSEPLARAAFDLQSRLYNILRMNFLQAFYTRKLYAETSTLWLIGQYLAWVEILRREVQVLDVGDSRQTADLQRRLFAVTDAFASDAGDERFMIFRQDQRAIGEIMVVSREVGDIKRSDCMGYAQFTEALSKEDFSRWFERLRRDLDSLATEAKHIGWQQSIQSPRLILLQRALINLIDLLDRERIRFPSLNERGKIPLPQSVRIRKQPLSPDSVARFIYVEGDPWSVFESWATANGLAVVHLDSSDEMVDKQAFRNGSLLRPGLLVNMSYSIEPGSSPWVEIMAHALSPARRKVDQRPHALQSHDGRFPINWWVRQARHTINDLLKRFDRPLIR